MTKKTRIKLTESKGHKKNGATRAYRRFGASAVDNLTSFVILFHLIYLTFMEEIINEIPETPAEKPAKTKLSWREYLETEQAVRVI